jgi:DNA gyrase inhibitor GyrI
MARPKLENRKATEIAYIEHRGPYDRVPWSDYIERLYAWAKGQGVMPGFHPMGTYLDDPKTTPPRECRSRVAISFKGAARAKDGVLTGHFPEMRVAALSHKGPASEIARSYQTLAEFIAEKGLRSAGPPIEVYSKKPEAVDGKVILYAKIMMPVE